MLVIIVLKKPGSITETFTPKLHISSLEGIESCGTWEQHQNVSMPTSLMGCSLMPEAWSTA